MSSNTTAIETLHAAVRFYSDERRNVLIVPISDIENFDHENCTNQPYYIKRHSKDNKHNSLLSPGEVLCVGSKEDLLNKEERYKFSKIRRSDALQQLQMKQIETDGTPKRETKITKKTLQKFGKMKNGQEELKKFLKKRKYLCTENNGNEDIMDLAYSLRTSYSTLDTDLEISPQKLNIKRQTDASKNQVSDTGIYTDTSDTEHDMSPIKRKKLHQSKKRYLSPGSKADKNEVACTR